jgi:hypothetical protein
VLQRNRSQVIQPMGGVSARPFFKPTTWKIAKETSITISKNALFVLGMNLIFVSKKARSTSFLDKIKFLYYDINSLKENNYLKDILLIF